jgi:apolipoprotein N-acyltransferase
MDNNALESGSHLILGIPIKADKSDGYHNAIITLGQEKHVYLKRRLVPFGEYSPLTGTYLENIFKLINLPLPDMTPGKIDQKPFTVGGVKILNAICYEIAFPELIQSADRDIGLILTVTNDAWFGKSNAQAQHLQMAEMRAQEFRRPSLFVSNDGITAMINAKGGIESAAPTHQTYVLNGTVTPMQGMTPWMRNGTDPFAVLIICMIVASIKSQRKFRSLSLSTANESAH